MEVATDCSKLGTHNECTIYDQRPQICRDHELDSCEMNGEGDAYPFILKSKEELDAFIDQHYTKKGNKYSRKEEEN